MLKLLLLCSCTQFVTCHCTTVLYISQYCTLADRDIIHITATCGHANVNIARHYIVDCTSQYCHSHIQMYMVYISIFAVYFFSCNIAVLFIISILFMCMSVFYFYIICTVLAFNVDSKERISLYRETCFSSLCT